MRGKVPGESSRCRKVVTRIQEAKQLREGAVCREGGGSNQGGLSLQPKHAAKDGPEVKGNPAARSGPLLRSAAMLGLLWKQSLLYCCQVWALNPGEARCKLRACTEEESAVKVESAAKEA
jgi:hypothetical protein